MEKLHNSLNLKDFNDFIDRKTLFDDVNLKIEDVEKKSNVI